MAWKLDDAWLWLGLGAFTFAATKGVGYALRDILVLTQINEQPQKQICAISQETEDALDARSLAVLAESHDRATRESAIHILADRFVRDQRAITSLTGDIYSADPATRSRAHVLRRTIERYASDSGPIQFLSESGVSLGRGGSFPLYNRSSIPAPLLPQQLREHEESFEEQELRRRRREAVVFHDGGGPVRQDDIIQRGVNGVPVEGRRNEAETRLVEDALRQITAVGND